MIQPRSDYVIMLGRYPSIHLCRYWWWRERRPSRRWSRRCWWQWTGRCRSPGRSPSAAARPATARSGLQCIMLPLSVIVIPLFTAEFTNHAGAQALALLQQLVQQQFDQACNASCYRFPLSLFRYPLFRYLQLNSRNRITNLSLYVAQSEIKSEPVTAISSA